MNLMKGQREFRSINCSSFSGTEVGNKVINIKPLAVEIPNGLTFFYLMRVLHCEQCGCFMMEMISLIFLFR